MSVQIFPAEIFDLFLGELGSATEDPESRASLLTCTVVNRQFYRRASSYIFSSLTITTNHSQKRLNDLREILNSNPNIARYIRSFTVETQVYTESLHAVLRQLSHLREFGWICEHFSQFHWNKPDTPASMIGNLFNLPYLTALHFENVMHLQLSLFSAFCHLESLTLNDVGFAKMGSNTMSAAPFSSLKRLEITGPLWSDEDVEAVKTIMTCAAPTLTTLILSKTNFMYSRFFMNLNPTVFPVLESIQMSCTIYTLGNTALELPAFICQLLDYSAPMVNQIAIEFEWDYLKPDQPFIFSLTNGWLPIDEVLSGPKYPALKTLDLIFSSRNLPVNSESNVQSSVWKFLKERLPAVSSCSHIETKIILD